MESLKRKSRQKPSDFSGILENGNGRIPVQQRCWFRHLQQGMAEQGLPFPKKDNQNRGRIEQVKNHRYPLEPVMPSLRPM